MAAVVEKTEVLEAELTEARAENERLRQRIKLLEKALFGPRSERLVEAPENQGTFSEMLAELEELSEQLDEVAEPPPPARPPRRRKKRRSLEELIPDDLPTEEIVLDVPEEDRVCLETGEPLVQIGEERSIKLAYKPGSYYKKVYIRPKYASRRDPGQGVLCLPMPPAAIPGCQFDESFMAGLAVDKVGSHLPLYRQEERLRGVGIEISRQTLSRLYMQTAAVLLPLYELMKADILARGAIFTDDTPVRLLMKGKGKTATGRMWVYVGCGPGPPYRVFEFTVDRKKNRPREFLGAYRGYIHADAYKGYADLFEQDGVDECACWMHVRRKFVEAEDAPVELRREVLQMIRRLYRYERFGRGKDNNVLLTVRQEKIGPLIDRLFARCTRAVADGEVLPKSAFARAVGYLQGRGDALRTFLADARLRPDNGESERAVRPLAIGRKNWLFAGSKRGGDATGILLSLVQSCRVLDINPFDYLTDVLRRLPATPKAELATLLPQAWRRARLTT